MGVLTDVGVLKDGKVVDSVWKSYVEDVKKMVSTGEGIFPPGIVCSKKVEPIRGAQVLELENQKVYPEFTKIWKPRYEAMVKSLDVNGDFQAAKSGLLPIIDPTAVAKVIGANPPNLDLAGALGIMIAGPPMGTQPFIALHFPELAADLPTLTKLLSPSSDFINIILPSVPIPPIPPIPDPRLLEFGYTEQFNFDLKLGLVPLKVHLKTMVPAIAVPELPKIIGKLASLDPSGLIEFMCKMIGDEQPEPMSTSSLEIAAQQVLIQHQVKYQALGFIGQQVGSGVITKGLAETPFDGGGLGVFKDVEEEEVEITYKTKLYSQVRNQARSIIDQVMRPTFKNEIPYAERYYPDGAFKAIAPLYGQTKIGGVLTDWDTAWTFIESLSVTAGETGFAKLKSTETPTGNQYTDDLYKNAKTKSDFGTAVYTAIKEGKITESAGQSALNVDLAKSMSKDQAAQKLEELRKESPIFNTMRGYTTCGEMPRYVYSKLQEMNGSTLNRYYNQSPLETSMKIKLNPKHPYVTLASGGLASMMVVGRKIEVENQLPRSSVWVIADPLAGQQFDVYTNKEFHPLVGDAILVRQHYSQGKRYDDHKTPVTLEGNISTDQRLQFYLPGAFSNIQHISIMYDRVYIDGREIWITVDAGQGSKSAQGAKYCLKQINRDPDYGIIIENDTGSIAKNESQSAQGTPRIVSGWLNIDLVTELQSSAQQNTTRQIFDAAKKDTNVLKSIEDQIKAIQNRS